MLAAGIVTNSTQRRVELFEVEGKGLGSFWPTAEGLKTVMLEDDDETRRAHRKDNRNGQDSSAADHEVHQE